MRRRTWLGVAMLLATVLVASLTATSLGAGKGPVKIGVVFWTQGAAKDLGDLSFNGANLAFDQVNAKGGILGGRKIQAIQVDEGYNADTVVTSGKKAVSDGAVALLGGNDATTCLPLAQYAKQANVPVAITACGSDQTIHIGYKGLVHLREPVVSGQAKKNALRALARWMVKVKHYKRVQGVGFDSQFVKNTNQEFSNYFKANAPKSFKYTGMIYLPYGTTNTRIEVTKAVSSHPDLLYMGIWGKDALVNSIKAARQAGYKGDIMTNEVVFLQPEADALGKDGYGVYSSTGWWLDPSIPASKAFDAAYFAKYHSHPEWFGELAYTGAKLLAAAINKAGSTDPAKIDKALHTTPVLTPRGDRLKFYSNGMRNAAFWILVQDVNGKIKPIAKIPMA